MTTATIHAPTTEAELSEIILAASGPISVRGGATRHVPRSGTPLTTRNLTGVQLYEPGALTLVARAGTPIDEIDALLAKRNQRLPFEPMDHRPLLGTTGQPTIGGVIGLNHCGARRLQAGAARDLLLGVRMVDGTGRIIKNGGRVMKNVTGYDLARLNCGARATLGIVTEICLKVLPLPEAAATLALDVTDPERAVRDMAAALGIATAAALTFTPTPYIYIAQTLYTGTGLFALIAIPGFILAGELMVRSKLTDQIIRVMFVLAGNIKGGLAVCTFLSCAFFAALSGSGPATTAAIGSIMIPAMVRAGYPVAWSAAVVASGGTLGILIPPSNPMIVYAVSANVSVTGLFLAGLIPGILLVALFSVYSWVYGHMTGLGKSGEPFRMKAFLAALWEGKAAMVMPVLVLGVIYGGLATPTEAAMLAVLYASAAGIISRKLGMKQFIEAMITTGKLTGAVLIIMGPATAFGRLLTLYGVPDQIAQTFISISENPLLILLLVSLLLIVIGTFMESLSSIVLLTPILLPPLVQLGVDPVQFGVLFVVLSQVGMLTPPLGVNLFVASAVSRTSIEKISLAVLPLIGLLLVFAFVLIIFPSLSTFAYGLVAR